MKVQTAAKILSPIIFFLLWYLLALLINSPLILPYPHIVITRLYSLAQTKTFWLAFAITSLRVFSAFLISLILGFFTGLLSADFPFVKALISFPLQVIRATPLVAFILITLFWFTSGKVPVFVAIIMSLPIVISSSEKGFEKNPQNQEKLFKAACYGFTGFKAFCYIRFPAALPSLFAGAESAFGLCWKVVAAGEVLSIPRYGAGSLMQHSQIHLETADTLALTLTIIMFSIICGYIFHSVIKLLAK